MARNKAKSKNADSVEPGVNGRPKIELDMDQLAALCRMKPSLYDCARFFKCSEDTIEKRIREYAGVTFTEFRDQHLMHTKYDLIRSAIKKAEHSETMHKFVLKNMADWRDKTDVTSDGKEMQAPPAQVTIVLPANGREGKK